MAETVGDFLVERLHAWGVRKIFGYPGDGINGVFGALNRAGGKIDFIQARHEEMAAFMASAYAKFTGELASASRHQAPAQRISSPASMMRGSITCRCWRSPDNRRAMPSAGIISRKLIFRASSRMWPAPSCSRRPPRRRCAISSIAPSASRSVNVVYAIILPNDLQDLAYEEPPRKHGTLRSGIGYTKPKVVPYDADLRRAASILNAGKKVAMLVGAGALNATDEVIAVADRLGAGVAKALLGKAALPDDLPYVTGSIGLLGTEPSYKMMMECDTLLMIGSGFPYAEFLPKEGRRAAYRSILRPKCCRCAIRWRSISSAMPPRP